jgi:hypothetical protein
MKRATLVLALLIIISGTISAQTKFTVPKNVVLVAKEDYAKYEDDIIKAAKWLEETALDREEDKRVEVNRFVMQWVMGSPTVNVPLTDAIAKLYGKNTALLPIYIASYTREFLEHKTTATPFSAAKAGIISMMNVYKKDIQITGSREMDRVIKLADDNKLDDYVREKLKE